jgi:Zn-dependent peptidase ImmA (M78 family)
MHGEEDGGSKVVESEAHWFAAAFLMPAEEIRPMLPSLPDWSQLQELKRTWGVSMQALLMRARNLRVMEPHVYVQAMKTMSARGWRRSEPVYLGPPEMPVLLGKAIDAVEKQGVTLDVIAASANLPLDEVYAFIGAGTDARPRVEI